MLKDVFTEHNFLANVQEMQATKIEAHSNLLCYSLINLNITYLIRNTHADLEI